MAGHGGASHVRRQQHSGPVLAPERRTCLQGPLGPRHRPQRAQRLSGLHREQLLPALKCVCCPSERRPSETSRGQRCPSAAQLVLPLSLRSPCSRRNPRCRDAGFVELGTAGAGEAHAIHPRAHTHHMPHTGHMPHTPMHTHATHTRTPCSLSHVSGRILGTISPELDEIQRGAGLSARSTRTHHRLQNGRGAGAGGAGSSRAPCDRALSQALSQAPWPPVPAAGPPLSSRGHNWVANPAPHSEQAA